MVEGGCQCWQVRYRITQPIRTVYVCHCRECQKQSASAFGMSIPVAMADFEVSGHVESWERATDLGSRTRCFFCPECGSRVYHQSNRSPECATVKGGSLDDPCALVPSAHIWVSRKQDWVIIDAGTPQHPTQPDDLDAWRHGLERMR